MTVKRYARINHGSGCWSMGEWPDGEYVRYDDYAALQPQVNALAAENSALKVWGRECIALWEAGSDMDSHLDHMPFALNTDAATLRNGEREYFVISVKHNQRSDRYVILWGANDSGYRGRVESAGRYPESRIREQLAYYNTGNNIAVPCEVIEQLSVPVEKGFFDTDDGHWVLNNRKNWQQILANVIEPPKYKPEPEYRGSPRRQEAS